MSLDTLTLTRWIISNLPCHFKDAFFKYLFTLIKGWKKWDKLYRKAINQFLAFCLFLYPLKISENLHKEYQKRFTDVFREHRKRPVARENSFYFSQKRYTFHRKKKTFVSNRSRCELKVLDN